MRPPKIVAAIVVLAAGMLLAAASAGVAQGRGESDESSMMSAIRPTPAGLPALKPSTLRTIGAIRAYLRRAGVNPAGFVVQRGRSNYAGPNCPGRNWTCTTARQVIQLAGAGGHNAVECTGGGGVLGPPQSCVIVQGSTTSAVKNDATCRVRSTDGIEQTCDITQTNGTGDNKAFVDMDVNDGGASQTASQHARVHQQNDSGRNFLHGIQDIDLWTFAGPTEDQNGYQDADLDQVSTSGDNHAFWKQSLAEDARAWSTAPVVQHQNTTPNPEPLDECVKFAPNQCASLAQESESGRNDFDLDQDINLNADVKRSGDVEQSQGCFECGIEGHVSQDSVEVSLSDAKQREVQKATAPFGAFQSQIIDPRCCEFQSSNPADQAKIHQDGRQDASSPDASQESQNRADCFSSGSCDTRSTLNQDGSSSDVRCHSQTPESVGCSTFQECFDNVGEELAAFVLGYRQPAANDESDFCTPSGEVPPLTGD
jgi:hypothetical protein